MMSRRVLLSWSSGKDSAWTLHVLRQQRDVEIVGLLTTFNEAAGRVAMHAVRRALVEAQASAAGLPLWPVLLPWPCSNAEYEQRMSAVIGRTREEGITHVGFGDLFLEDVRDYRIRQLSGTGVEPLFPLWGSPADTPGLARRMLDGGLRAVLTCVDPKQLPESFAGRPYDAALLADLPPGVDACGERGEFHTFCFAGPMFASEIAVQVGETLPRDGFCFTDLVPSASAVNSQEAANKALQRTGYVVIGEAASERAAQTDQHVDRVGCRAALEASLHVGRRCNARLTRTLATLLLAVLPIRAKAETPFASSVVDFSPAPGEFVNDPNFNDPPRALGPPSGAGTSAPNNMSVVSLGGFGGYIVLGFDHTVVDDPLNPYGMDAIVFGNAFWIGGDPDRHWAECATIEISLDEDGNGEADDTWYLIPGSHIPDPTGQFLVVTWDDDVADDTFPPAFDTWIPPRLSGMWTTEAYELPAALFGPPVVTNPSTDPSVEGIFGYAEYSPTLLLGDLDADNVVDDPTILPEEFYTVPDDPLTVGMTAGSGGGDAFDIAWAIDPITGDAAELYGFDFIRLTSAVDSVSPILGEKSAEIDAVADVAPDPFGDADDDGDIDLADAAYSQSCFGGSSNAAPACARVDREPNRVVDLADVAAFIARMTGPL